VCFNVPRHAQHKQRLANANLQKLQTLPRTAAQDQPSRLSQSQGNDGEKLRWNFKTKTIALEKVRQSLSPLARYDSIGQSATQFTLGEARLVHA